jgi:hypothetical protein
VQQWSPWQARESSPSSPLGRQASEAGPGSRVWRGHCPSDWLRSVNLTEGTRPGPHSATRAIADYADLRIMPMSSRKVLC